MAATITMDRDGCLELPQAVRERYGLTGGPHQIEVVEGLGEIVLRPVGFRVSATRDASGWVVFRSEGFEAGSGRRDREMK